MAFIYTCFCIPLLLLVLNCAQDGYASNANILRNIDAAVITSDGQLNGDTNVEASARANKHDIVSGISCPDTEDIFPCMCTSEPGEEHVNLDLDCSEVENEDQLAQIMASPFPSTNFRSLTIVENANLKVLRVGILGNTTYEEFYIYWSALEEVEAGALSGSHSTATQIVLPSNKITMFPWEELPLFTSLVTLELSDNKITPFPTLASESLQNLGLILNPLESLPLTAFRATPSLLTISLEKARISNVIPGTFNGLAQLLDVDLSGNELNELLTGTVHFTSTGRHYLLFQQNNISRVAPSAFTGLSSGDGIFLAANNLTVLEEVVWRPLLEDGVQLFLMGNPLVCGCDIAWIMLNSTFLSFIAEDTMCADGRLLVDLDPTFYQDHCSTALL